MKQLSSSPPFPIKRVDIVPRYNNFSAFNKMKRNKTKKIKKDERIVQTMPSFEESVVAL